MARGRIRNQDRPGGETVRRCCSQATRTQHTPGATSGLGRRAGHGPVAGAAAPATGREAQLPRLRSPTRTVESNTR